MQRIVHETGDNNKRVHFVYPDEGNIMSSTHKRFPRIQKKVAKRNFKKFKKNKPQHWNLGVKFVVANALTKSLRPDSSWWLVDNESGLLCI